MLTWRLLPLIVLVSASYCGGRPVTVTDGAISEGRSGPLLDLPPVALDAYRGTEAPWPDVCSAWSPTQLDGSYYGDMKLTSWKCFGWPESQYAGIGMFLSVTGGPGSLTVSGSLAGKVGPGFLPLVGTVKGTMSCGTFGADSDDVSIPVTGQPTKLTKLAADWTGTVTVDSNGIVRCNGNWTMHALGGGCSATGTWTVTRNGH